MDMSHLPVELLEKITAYLVPTKTKRQIKSSTKSLYAPISPQWFKENRQDWANDCKNLRRTCKRFANLWTPSAALFHDFYLFVSSRSIDNFQHLSQHESLRRHVRRIIIFKPLFSSYLTVYDAYLQAQNAEWDMQVMSIVEKARSFLGDTCFLMEKLLNHCFIPPTDTSGFDLYVKLYQAQQKLLEDGIYVEQVSTSIFALPKLSSILLSGGDGVEDTGFNQGEPTWFQRRHPEVLLRLANVRQLVWDDSDETIMSLSLIFRTLFQSNARPQEIRFVNNFRIPTWFEWDSVPRLPNCLVMSNLRRLDLTTNAYLFEDDCNFSIIQPFLPADTRLEELYLDAYRGVYISQDFLGFTAPRLKSLSLKGFWLSGKVLAEFLRRHTRLMNLSLYLSTEPGKDSKSILTAIHGLPAICALDLEISLIMDVAVSPCVRVVTGKLADCRPDPVTYHYLHGEGAWTQSLSRIFGDE